MMWKTARRVVALLLCAACVPRLAPEPAPVPTPHEVVRTTATKLDASVVLTLTAGAPFDTPAGKYLVVWATESESTCMTNCACPEPVNAWSDLLASEQEQIMRDMIRKGAKGFVRWSRSEMVAMCSCGIGEEWIEPLNRLPYTDHATGATLYRIDPDGAVTAEVGGIVYRFMPGDTWFHESSVQVTSPPVPPTLTPSAENAPESCPSIPCRTQLSLRATGYSAATVRTPLSSSGMSVTLGRLPRHGRMSPHLSRIADAGRPTAGS